MCAQPSTSERVAVRLRVWTRRRFSERSEPRTRRSHLERAGRYTDLCCGCAGTRRDGTPVEASVTAARWSAVPLAAVALVPEGWPAGADRGRARSRARRAPLLALRAAGAATPAVARPARAAGPSAVAQPACLARSPHSLARKSRIARRDPGSVGRLAVDRLRRRVRGSTREREAWSWPITTRRRRAPLTGAAVVVRSRSRRSSSPGDGLRLPRHPQRAHRRGAARVRGRRRWARGPLVRVHAHGGGVRAHRRAAAPRARGRRRAGRGERRRRRAGRAAAVPGPRSMAVPRPVPRGHVPGSAGEPRHPRGRRRHLPVVQPLRRRRDRRAPGLSVHGGMDAAAGRRRRPRDGKAMARAARHRQRAGRGGRHARAARRGRRRGQRRRLRGLGRVARDRRGAAPARRRAAAPQRRADT